MTSRFAPTAVHLLNWLLVKIRITPPSGISMAKESFRWLEEVGLAEVVGGNPFLKQGTPPFYFVGREPADTSRVILKKGSGGIVRGEEGWIKKKEGLPNRVAG